jgi:5-(carboxyamino)imidazole ribonucleotide mutase
MDCHFPASGFRPDAKLTLPARLDKAGTAPCAPCALDVSQPDDPETPSDKRGRVSAALRPVAIVMGSQSDWPTMRRAAETLRELGVGYDARIVSAHRTPDRLVAFAKGARGAGVKVIIAGAGGAAHLPGMTAAFTTLPVFGVPVESKTLSGQDSLLSIVQMPAGVPVGTLAIGPAGAINAALLAASVLALSDVELAARLEAWRAAHRDAVPEVPTDGPAE